ncbi:BlaI/MecI/CopY family transcriptional regulator [Clostridium gasigenes]|uniref:BlaI family transcriptional regulator, penicillinase repressor n=1 Tax=Clostridium gasigenes TaxID=94869 RepID=A0A1H0NXV2_9CLOT|nr:BlaI/MecI/CopY family transcriptional regulator [Clostridium gasigenes]MBB6623548.1 BlaI/MecI/CopY family transcriptional regulator [Clostridium gasigenes]MBU3087664.1 BlaI/MecI/CopY family transcriptional regulator [Clostridium gasigenes]SDO97220.1 BlaI family transcriptional regulator, penicillinase repressor [Clostridium gasigenes]
MLPKISDAEWEVMKIIWSSSKITSSEIINELNDKSKWTSSTIKSLINRLLNKKAISFEKKSKEYFYYSLVSEKECIKEESESFVNRVFNGSFNSMFVNFVKSESLSEEDIEELRQILNTSKNRGEM